MRAYSVAPTRPWIVKRTSIYGANDQLVFVGAPMTTDTDTVLAAAAPELLAALKALRDPAYGNPSEVLATAQADMDADAAIAKAEGRL